MERGAIRGAIRAATPADARRIGEVHVASWRWAYEGMLSEAFQHRVDCENRPTVRYVAPLARGSLADRAG